jgi:acetylglutamate kinase
MWTPVVIKIGGHEITDSAYLNEMASVLHNLKRPAIIVHGGGKEISALQQELGIEPQYIDGVRVTDAASLSLVKMVLCGTVNKRIVRHLMAVGVDALGLSGVDRGLVRAQKMQHDTVDMGFTGSVTEVRSDVLHNLLENGITPVIAPICLGREQDYNVNADHVAGAVAAAVNASRVIFLTNVEGVLRDGQHIPTLTADDAEQLITAGVISGGMIPKVRTALATLGAAVPRAVITNLAGLKSHGGTVFSV